jgi:hypothetical protein
MKRLIVGALAAVALVSVSSTLLAQSKTLTGQTKVETATVEAIEASSRTVTLKKTDGTYVSIVAGPDIKRFDEIKIGDTVTAKYYDNLVIRMKQPGEADVASTAMATKGSKQPLPGGTQARQTTITATIAAIDQKIPSITFTGPNGWKYTSKVEDTKALAKVHVGDKVDIIWTEALLVSIDRGK